MLLIFINGSRFNVLGVKEEHLELFKYFFQRVVKWIADLTQREIVSGASAPFLWLAHVKPMFPIETNELANVDKGRERV